MSNENSENGKAYQIAANSFQELDALEPGDPETRNRILLRAAVLSYVELADPASLIALFEKGFPLHQYPESRDLLVDLISGVPIPPAIKSDSKKSRDAEMKAAYYYATLTGSGKSPEEAARLVSKGVPCSADHFSNVIWPEFQHRPGVKIAFDTAANPPENFPEFF